MNIKPTTNRRYSSEQEILDAIDAAHKKAAALDVEAHDFDLLKEEAIGNAIKSADEGADGMAEFWRDKMHEYKSLAAKRRRSADNLRDKKCLELGRLLSAFRTEPMAFLAGDRGVSA